MYQVWLRYLSRFLCSAPETKRAGRTDGRKDGRTEGRKDGRTEGRKDGHQPPFLYPPATSWRGIITAEQEKDLWLMIKKS